jgi:hypothetical protein
MIKSHYLHKFRRDDEKDYYDQDQLIEKANEYIETKLKEENLANVIKWDLSDVGANGIQLRGFIGKSTMLGFCDPEFTIKYDMSNLYEKMDAFLAYHIGQCKKYKFNESSHPTKFQEEMFERYGCD